MLKLAVFASGSGTNFQAILDAVESGRLKARVSVLFSNNKDAFAIERAGRLSIPSIDISKKLFRDEQERESYIASKLEENEIDMIVLAGYLGIISPGIVRKFRNRIINIHPSLLPRHSGKGYHGMKVHESVIASGETESGATVHFVDEGIDTGEVIKQRIIHVMPEDSPSTLAARVLEVEHELLVDVLVEFAQEYIEKR